MGDSQTQGAGSSEASIASKQRLPFTELENIDIDAARKRLDKAIAARNKAEREVHNARHAYEKLLYKDRPAAWGNQASATKIDTQWAHNG